jgi:EAL domain-containing protein (putative c-di-GMP-specific phosphodiesterase class I)
VNISAAEFRQRDLPRRIAKVLESTGLPPKQLKLELTESVLIQDIPSTLEMLGELLRARSGPGDRRLRDGLLIAQLPAAVSGGHVGKWTSRSFARLGLGCDLGAVLRAIVEMGNALKMNVVAEGIENTWQWDFLFGIGCKQGQGHLFRPAVDGAEFGRLVAAHGPLVSRRKPILPRAG